MSCKRRTSHHAKTDKHFPGTPFKAPRNRLHREHRSLPLVYIPFRKAPRDKLHKTSLPLEPLSEHQTTQEIMTDNLYWDSFQRERLACFWWLVLLLKDIVCYFDVLYRPLPLDNTSFSARYLYILYVIFEHFKMCWFFHSCRVRCIILG